MAIEVGVAENEGGENAVTYLVLRRESTELQRIDTGWDDPDFGCKPDRALDWFWPSHARHEAGRA